MGYNFRREIELRCFRDARKNFDDLAFALTLRLFSKFKEIKCLKSPLIQIILYCFDAFRKLI